MDIVSYFHLAVSIGNSFWKYTKTITLARVLKWPTYQCVDQVTSKTKRRVVLQVSDS